MESCSLHRHVVDVCSTNVRLPSSVSETAVPLGNWKVMAQSPCCENGSIFPILIREGSRTKLFVVSHPHSRRGGEG